MPDLPGSTPQIKPLETPEEASPFVTAVLGLSLGIVILTAGLFFLKAVKGSQLKQAEAEYQQDVEELMSAPAFKKQEEEVDKVGLQVETLKKTLADRDYYSKFLDEIPQVTFKYAQFSNLAVGEEGEVTVEGRTETFVDLARTLAAFRASSDFQEVTLTSANLDTENKLVTFSFKFKLAPQALLKEKQPEVSTAPEAQLPTPTGVEMAPSAEATIP